jgi:membrane-associated phospholipid phosphatase
MIAFLSELYNEFGNFGPVILFFLSIFLLWNNDNLFFYYIVGIFSNSILNLILKGLIQQPRPGEDITKFNLALTHGKRFLFKDGIPHDIFGMPSGHSQSVLFSTVFVYLSLRKNKLLYIYLIISLLTITQRVVYDYHTILQVIAGSLVGGSFGYFVYYLAREKIKGHITEKLDDYGPI